MEESLQTLLKRPDLNAITTHMQNLTGIAVCLYDKAGEPISQTSSVVPCNLFVAAHAEAAGCQQEIRQTVRTEQENELKLHTCPHGFHYATLPIFVKDRHAATLVLRDFVLDEPSDEMVRQITERFGYELEEYLTAMHKMPQLSRQQVQELSRLYCHMIGMLADLDGNHARLEDMRQAMQESIRFYYSLMQRNHAILLIIDPETGEVFDSSLGAEEFYGYSQQELRGMPLRTLTKNDPTTLLDYLRKQMARAVSNYRAQHRLRSGELREVDMQLTQVELQGRNLTLVIVQDITRQLEEEDKRRQTEEKLVQAQKLEALGTLASGIAHDFNNILSAMIGYAELSKMQLDEALPVQGHLNEILRAGDRAKDLVNQILTFSHQVKTNPRPILIAGIVKEALKLLRITIPTTIEIQQEIDTTVGHIIADPTQIHQVLMNLCTNAYHAMHPRGGIMTVRLEQERVTYGLRARFPNLPQQTDDFICLSVMDDGCGMDEDTMNRIFDPFFTTKREGRGTGLGLATVYGIVEDLEGCIEVHSEPGKGSRFDIWLPKATTGELPGEGSAELIVRGNGEHILLIDDEESIITIGRLMLTRMGYRVTAMQQPVEALALFENEPDSFDAVLTDFAMPKMNGFDIADRVIKLRPGTPVFMITGYNEELAEEFDSHGVQRILHKPIDWKYISRIIQQYRYAP